jgi:hypothetical protein
MVPCQRPDIAVKILIALPWVEWLVLTRTDIRQAHRLPLWFAKIAKSLLLMFQIKSLC